MTTDAPTITVYWRPGCLYCARLRRGLASAGTATVEVNVWTDDTASAFVRSVAGGNEVVPTVTVGGTTMVNPTTAEVLRAAGLPVPPSRSLWRRLLGG